MNINKYLLLSITIVAGKIFADQTVEIKGPVVAPWVKGKLCAHYKNKGEHITRCFDISAGKKYTIADVPGNAKRIKITRSFANKCITKKHSATKCKTVKGNFYLTAPSTILNLTYDNSKIFKDITISPAEKQSYFGYPQQYGSVLFPSNYRSQPDSRAV